MTIEYQRKKLIALRKFAKGAKIIPVLEKMVTNENCLIVDPKGAFFDFQGTERNYYLYAVYKHSGGLPGFLTYLKKLVNQNGKTIRYETTIS